MMILSIVIAILSSLIQGITSKYIGYNYTDLSLFSTIYILITLLIVKPHFENEKKFLILLIVFGLLMDITYTGSTFFNACLFIVVYYFSKVFHFFLPYNLFTINISNLLGIFLYHIISFAFLSILRYDNYTVSVLTKILTNSILMTLIYTTFIYSSIHFLKKKFELRNVK